MDGGEREEEQGVSIKEYIEGEDAQQLEADLVLGGDEGNECTYEKGYMKRQAVFSCLTCTPAGDAGFCTACSLKCHDGHVIVELWTRRGFRCDCGNKKFGALQCQLFNDKEPQNKGNVYNQNFRGLYCSCHRPFPDPDRAEQGEMLQCCICEDWLHDSHLGLPLSHQVPRDDQNEPSFDELVCPACVDRVSFLSHYPDVFVPPMEIDEDVEVDEDAVPPSDDVEDEPSAVSQDDSEVPVPEPTPDVLMNGNPAAAAGSNGNSSTPITEESRKVKLQSSGKRNPETASGESSNGGVQVCKLTLHTASQLGANGMSKSEGVEIETAKQLRAGEGIFLAQFWRAELCRCDSCLQMYTAKGLGFLLDDGDTLQEYEDAAKKKRAECQVKADQNTSDYLKNLGHVQKMELIHGVTEMANQLGSFLEPFGESGRTVTSADIYEFFEKLEQKRRRLN